MNINELIDLAQSVETEDPNRLGSSVNLRV